VRTGQGRNEAGTRSGVQLRRFGPPASDQPHNTMGGTNTAPSSLEAVLIALARCDGVLIRGVAFSDTPGLRHGPVARR